ncbi:hypothetical protein H6G89_13520 [Oscillatoria sp. FACHB-1407]|uniref:hypothetical protein n=1 Tax=Oscillatoria sp. FACHB-1407 TaxID=2692847 RepID=UPI001682196C|nr:hypothetical protein [Oscillatoria sp. FACHB-1407]MBD2462068.1 hypothetical protein [Oscillatoria sp. FACHB-1407]
MNILKTSAIALTACVMTAGMALVGSQAARAEDYESFTLAPGFRPNPVVGTGLSGGTRLVDCYTNESGGRTLVRTYVDSANAPDHVVTVTRPFSNLRASVQADGDVTLLIDGPDGTYCSDDVDGLMPSISGNWPAGTYNIWIGDFVGDGSGVYRYRLFLTQQ